METILKCAYCGKPHGQPQNHINRAIKVGAPLYCNRVCAGFGRRNHKAKAQKVEEKRIYDAEYRVKNRAMLKAKKSDYFQRTYDPKEAAVYRKKRMHLHVAYCRRPEYLKYKKVYDRKYRAKKDFGPLWESAVLLLQIEEEVNSRITRNEVYRQNGTQNKSIKRKREYAKIIGSQS